jgi:hypothetical protein
MIRNTLLLSILCVVFVGCGDDGAAVDGNDNPAIDGNGNSELGSEPEPGPANEINAEIAGSDGSTTSISGSAEDLTPETNQATVALGSLTVFLSASDGTLTTFAVDAPMDTIPGTVDITSEGASGTWLTIASMEGIYTSTGGSITVNQCPEAGATITGTFDVSLADFFGGTSTLTGTWRTTVALSDNSITCRVIEPEPEPEPVDGTGDGTDDGSGDGTGDTSVCDLEECDGPCCPLIEPTLQCYFECEQGPCNPMNPGFDMSGGECAECFMDCEDISLDDPECSSPYLALNECSAASGCDAFDRFEDEHLACVEANCCTEAQAAF